MRWPAWVNSFSVVAMECVPFIAKGHQDIHDGILDSSSLCPPETVAFSPEGGDGDNKFDQAPVDFSPRGPRQSAQHRE